MRDKPLFWDCVAGIYDLFVNVVNKKTHKVLRTRIRHLIDSSDTVLECACGTGMLTEIIASECRKLIATDFSKNMVRKTKSKCGNYKNIRFSVADIMRLEFPDAAFDKVVAANVIHLLGDPYKALKELYRVCRPGGKIIIPTYISKQLNNRENIFVKIIERLGAGFKQEFSFSSYRQFFKDAGYADARYIRIDGFIPCSIAVIEKK